MLTNTDLEEYKFKRKEYIYLLNAGSILGPIILHRKYRAPNAAVDNKDILSSLSLNHGDTRPSMR